MKVSTRLMVLIGVFILLALWIVFPRAAGAPVKLGTWTFNRTFDTRLGLDLVGGVQALLEADLPADQVVDAQAMSSARDIVENRVNGLGVSEAVVQLAGDRRILVELPGETDPQKALATIQQTGLLEFVDFSQVPAAEAQAMEGKEVKTDFGVSGASAPAAGETPAATVPPSAAVTPEVTAAAAAAASPAGSETPAATPAAGETPAAPAPTYHTVMTGAALKQVSAGLNKTGQYQVAFELTADGAKTFSEYTSSHVGQILAIVLDKKVVSAPRINSAITDGRGVITGSFDYQSANNLAVQLRYGSLPIPLKVVTSQTVGPTLGKLSLNKSLLAGLIGVLVVMVYMGLYYRVPGVLADLALLVYGLLSLALFKFIPVTLTLPGIAGFVLSMGVAVDANILIFERMKEELRAGKPLRQAIDLAWKRAWPSIRDSNLSTLITCMILFWFGSNFGASIVKGFSLTLAIGVAVSMFTAITVTRTFLHLALDKVGISEHPKWFGVSE